MRGQGSLDSFGTILASLAKRLGLQSHLFELKLQQQWRALVGEPIGSHTWPTHIRFKKLHLTVRNSVWLQQLTFLKPTLMATLNERAGTTLIEDIAFRVGEIPGPADRLAEDPSASVPLPALAPDLSAQVATIQSPDIRQRLTEVIGSYPSPVPPQPGAGPSRVP
jgi:hypothetical protein